MKNIGILGYGEIGKSLKKVYLKHSQCDVFVKDLNRDDGLTEVECLNVCIPYTENFVDIVIKEVSLIKPSLVIIHSTIIPGTTEKLNSLLNVPIIHSPIMGIHPNLYDGIMTFKKFIGADSKESGLLAKKHLESLGIITELVSSSTTTELGKLLSTTYYGAVIAMHGEMNKICNEFNVDFSQAVTLFNQIYNNGYTKLNKLNVIRPVLYPPNNNTIGGHCVVPNAELLKKCLQQNNEIIELILKYKK